ncbi:polysaccharide deacetylase [Mobilitalea sibirica]|uniref:Polysaccharide deacetylase n=1 Tax=Mobilitalea sibirica TaxID=1462919 RepID=A0A8J7KTN3_9FIRM|nr:polysaccharide deacetylase family protein [Mobilitalea sibirica]MBH1941571.1 polysaccharide deacetylase [Mobilitalea sibirica]
MNKFFTGLAFLLIGILFIYILVEGKERLEQKQVVSERIVNGQRSIELMAEMENMMHREKDTSSQTSSDEMPDYTKLYPDLYTEYCIPKPMEKGKKIAYLTFDDGPSENTFKVLDILEERNVRATFFLVGTSITAEREDCLQRMVNEGHTIGIHSYSHICNEIYCSIERYLDDFNTIYQQIYEITGERVSIYRFPLGSNNGYSKKIKDALIEEMERRGFTCYDWNVSANDSIGKPTAYSIRQNIEKDLKNQDYPIILLHDSAINDTTAKILPDIITLLSEKGYEFDTLDKRVPYQFQW